MHDSLGFVQNVRENKNNLPILPHYGGNTPTNLYNPPKSVPRYYAKLHTIYEPSIKCVFRHFAKISAIYENLRKESSQKIPYKN